MKTRYMITLLALMLVGSSSFAKQRTTAVEERRAAIVGGVVGAGLGGPVGAAAGAIFGGGIVGKLIGTHRINRELELELKTQAATFDGHQGKMHTEVEELNQQLAQMIKRQTASWNSRQLPVQFRTGSSAIESHYEKQLDEIAGILSRNLDTKVSLAGFADRRGSSEYNLELSKRRVGQVRQYLIDHGVRMEQIGTDAFGESRPVSAEESYENDFFDRRVVMEFSFDLESYLATR